jgi:Ca-activated chloride channel family protein
MNRTAAFLSLAGALGLLALVLAAPRPTDVPSPPPPSPQPPLVHQPVLPSPPPPEPQGSLAMTGRLSHPVVGVGSSDVFVTVDVQGVEMPGQPRAAVNLALVIDRSCSMAGEPLLHAKQAAAHLVGQLREDDRLAIVHYGSDVRVLPGMNATLENRGRMLAFIRRITDDGGTNISDGLAAGKAQALRAASDFKVNRLILISDGQPTEGITDERGLLNLSARIRRDGVSISAIGVGTEFNERVMQGIAENGSGAYAYLRDAGMLASIFQRDLQQAGTTVARDVELSFELPAGVELKEVLGYHHTRAGRTVRVPLADISAGQLERVVARVRVTGQAPGQAVEVAGLKLSYRDLLAERPAEASAALAALTSDRQEEIASRRDKQVAVFAARAEAAGNLSKAADLYGAGRRDEARRIMQQNAQVYREAAAVAGPAAVAADAEANDQILGAFEAAPAGGAMQHQVKDAKAAARKGFGRVGSTY